jgi:hypothetical protein
MVAKTDSYGKYDAYWEATLPRERFIALYTVIADAVLLKAAID